MDYFASFLKQLEIEPKDVKTYSPLSLAYLGDNVYDLYIRYMIVAKSNTQVNQYHRKATAYVKAHGQVLFYDKIKDDLTEEEQTIFKRGRNAKTVHVPKHSNRLEYGIATGLETLIGYLFMTGQRERLNELMVKGVSKHDQTDQTTD